MEDVEKDQEDEKMDIQSSYSSKITDFRQRLLQWLQKEWPSPETEDSEDQDLDALLLKVPHKDPPRLIPDRAIPRTASFARHFASITNRSFNTVLHSGR